MSDIDWLAVDMVCQGTPMVLKPDEKKMVIRRLADRMLGSDDWYWSASTAAKLTAPQLAERLLILDPTTRKPKPTTERSVQRMKDELPAAQKQTCPVCREDMWVLNDSGVVERHADSLFEQCPMSGRQMLKGLAAIRPDLYRWLEVSA